MENQTYNTLAALVAQQATCLRDEARATYWATLAVALFLGLLVAAV